MTQRPQDLDLSAESMERVLTDVGRRTIAFLASLADQPSHANEAGPEVASRLAAEREPPEDGSPLEAILDELFGSIIPCALNTAGPGYLAYVPGGGLFSTAVAEFLAAAVNRYAGVWVAAPGAVEVETQAVRWLARLLGMPDGTLGTLTTGGSMSNLLALVAAREKLLEGELDSGTVYYSEQVHYSLPKAARVAGIPRKNLRALPVDEHYRLRVDELTAAVRRDRASGLRPFFVCGSAGTVNTGNVDPLREIAEVAQAEALWFHVDGAYGAAFRLVPELAGVFDGMAEADSIAVDPHKGLFLPYGTGALLVRHIEDLRAAFGETAEYLPESQTGDERLDFFSLSPELSRSWRGIRLWLPLKLHGARAFREALADKRRLACEVWETLRAEPDVEIASPPDLSLFAFRQRFAGVTLDEENRRNRRLLERINAPRRIFLTATTLDGRYFVRVCVLHLRTHEERVREGIEIIRAALAQNRIE